MNFLKKMGVVTALVMTFSATAWANSAYTVVNPNYSAGKVGTIASNNGMVNPNATGALDGAPAVHSFTDANGQPRVLVYKYSGAAPKAVIYNPTTTPWTQVGTVANLEGKDFANLYGVTTVGNFLYVIDYDKGKVVKINMANNAYSAGEVYTFQGTAGYDAHGMAITAVGNEIYGLFAEVKDPWGAADYLPSKVVKLNKDTLMPISMPAQVGKNAFTLKSFNNKLYIASLGGKQNSDAYNSGQSRIDIVNLANMSVTTPITAGQNLPYDLRDITFNSNGDAYILAGKYINTYATMQGVVYKTTAAGIAVGQIGALKEQFNTAGYCWALHYESAADRLWFAKGNQIDLRTGSTYNVVRNNMAAQTVLGGASYPNLNSLTLIGQGVTLQGYQDPAHAAGHATSKLMRKIKNDRK